MTERRSAEKPRRYSKSRKLAVLISHDDNARAEARRHGRAVGIGHNLGPPLAPLLDDHCLTFLQWCQLNSIGQRTGRRILKSGNGPAVVQLSERRIGITIRANRTWQMSRERAPVEVTSESVRKGR